MQEELIEMLEEIIQYVEVWNAHDQGIIDKAEALVEKAKNCAKEPAVPQGFATLNEWFLSLPEQRQVQLRDDKWMLANAAFMANRTAAPSQPVTLTDSYAGVIAWVGDKQCKRVLTEGAIKKEHTPGVAMRNTAHQCVQEVIIAALREKEARK